MSTTHSASSFAGGSESVILVTAPRCSPDRSGSDVVTVEPECCETVRLNRNPLLQFLESKFGAEEKDPKAQEMEEIPLKVITSGSERAKEDEFDHCQEYSLESKECSSKNEGATATGPLTSAGLVASALLSSSIHSDYAEVQEQKGAQAEKVAKSYVLGKVFHPIHDFAARRDDEAALFWHTYRCDFPEIKPYNITSDAGWGCMLRSAQMMLAQALRLHFKSREWTPPGSLSRRRQDPFIRSMLTWFADYPSSNECIYSLHNMVAAGLAFDKLPGEWYGPGTACYVIRALVQMHDRRQPSQLPRRMFRVLVASQGSVYRDTIDDAMLSEARDRLEVERTKKSKVKPQAHPLDLKWEEELMESFDSEWDTSLLLLIPLRLGLDTFNVEYAQALAHVFSLPQSVGVLGGRPRGARWFYGAQENGDKIFGLDPHTVQACPSRRTARVNGELSSVIELSDEYLRSYHTTNPEIFSLAKMDPSIAVGFFCKSRDDLNNVLDSVQEWKCAHPTSPELFSVADRAPDYSASVDDFGDSSFLDQSGQLASNEEDEYVVL